jgi:hypothetical protein
MSDKDYLTFSGLVFCSVVMAFFTWHFWWGVFGLYPGISGGGYAVGAYLTLVMFYLYLVNDFFEGLSKRMEAQEKKDQLQVEMSRRRDANELHQSRQRDGQPANNFWKGNTHD